MRGIREIGLVATLYVVYTGLRLLAADAQAPALHRARRLLRIETALGVDWERSVVRFVEAHPLVGLLSCYWYSTVHYVVSPLVLLWLYRQGWRAYLPGRRVLAIATGLALVFYLALPTAPPRMFPGYADILALHADAGWWGADASAPRGTGDFTNQLAAFPSMHAGWSLWVALALQRWSGRRSLQVTGWIYCALTAAVIVGTANHWVLDVVIGWLVVVIGWLAVRQSSRAGRMDAVARPVAMPVPAGATQVEPAGRLTRRRERGPWSPDRPS